MLIERGQADAIRLVRSTVNPTPGTGTVNEPMEMNATGGSGVPPMVFVDDEGLEEQFLTEDEDTPNILNIKPDMPIKVYTQFCLNTAKSKFSLVSPVAD